jgi:two-component sensor histidine kinase
MPASAAPAAAAVTMAISELDDAPDIALPRLPVTGFLVAWVAFWILMMTIAVQEHVREGHGDIWKPLLWEGTSFLVASVILGSQWLRLHRHDRLLSQPWRWFGANLVWLPVAAVAFVVAVYAIRHGIYALIGETYRHAAWPVIFRYEILKFSLFYLLFVAILFGVRSHVAMSAQRVRAERARTLVQEAQLTQLTQQLEPHFLFNALNTIAATVHTNPDLADTLLTRLAALLRAATDLTRQPEIEFAEELRLLDAYVTIMRERFADRVEVRFDIADAARSCRVPTLLLQPLIENAFRHAVEPRATRTTIDVRAQIVSGRLVLEVGDDGGALPAAPTSGVGLTNLQRRLALRYGERARLTLAPRPGGGVLSRIELPCGS